ncbi:LacI family DNA-binding transcriptional regulator [Deinococcus cellulosilyticus]|uniref:LacI family transcriptional regulator n=1 Tax=Deinococcus cellulosilyticus (strain DSM 18568 / NBRC 106333 / KACC 11606 / 5516J-15) TaxID=1223518 RepID=A0A511MWT2_DEIC1|nr:LacI family DNA-binding transcriptional regulator [Deinococcus cellulosilyticus]GEM44596.1 LacI family transcriptional regulator [Deinococcus cellulosilyticus NBRC 106333 = KACC 11606]
MKKRNVTINEVARAAGVSISTVSRIINGTAFVAEDKREAVEAALKQLGFQPNYLARTLISGRSMSIGVIAEDIVSPYFADVIRGIEHHLLDTDYQPILNSGHWSSPYELRAIETLIYRKVDALILLGSTLEDSKLLEIAERVPLFIFGRIVKGLEDRCLALDQFKGGYLATRHLIELGHRDIVHITGPENHLDALERLRGYQTALEDSGIPFQPQLVLQGDFLERTAYLSTLKLIESLSSFTAIFAANDQMAAGARLALYRKGLRIPDDVSLVGYDDLPGTAFMSPPLTTVHQPTYDIGQALAKHVLQVIQEELAEMPEFELSLVVRESTSRLHRGYRV